MGPEQLEELMERYAAGLMLYARQWCATPEDVVQDAFVKLATLRRAPDQPKAWLYVAVRNRAISAARAEARRKHHEARAGQYSQPWFRVDCGSALDAQEAAWSLQQLPVEQREVIVAHLWGELTFEQIAQLVGCSSSTAHRRYVDGLALLRQKLGIPCPSNANRSIGTASRTP